VVWESHTPAPPPPSLPQEQNLTIGEVAALCSSPLKFVFKCREIELFNKFLRSQKKRIISSSISSNSTLHLDDDDNNNNSDCFRIIRSGAECGTIILCLVAFHHHINCIIVLTATTTTHGWWAIKLQRHMSCLNPKP
jgi:UDP-N-acetylmuramate-alanine ligase